MEALLRFYKCPKLRKAAKVEEAEAVLGNTEVDLTHGTPDLYTGGADPAAPTLSKLLVLMPQCCRPLGCTKGVWQGTDRAKAKGKLLNEADQWPLLALVIINR